MDRGDQKFRGLLQHRSSSCCPCLPIASQCRRCDTGLTTFADLIDGPLAHIPSGRFAANSAWAICAAIAHNLLCAACSVELRQLEYFIAVAGEMNFSER